MWFLLLSACGGFQPSDPIDRALPTVQPGAPLAGVAEGPIRFAMGSPLGGYTGRCNCFGNAGEVDDRLSPYAFSFNPSAGVQTMPRGQALWLSNGDQDLVVVKADVIYSSDHLLYALTDRLEEATGLDLDGKVVIVASHTHNAPGNWHPGMTWWLGGDRANRESFERFLSSLTEIALDAYADLQPAAIGVGIAEDWDPDDLVYSDRREENDDTVFFDDIPAGPYKDPHLMLLRVDTADGQPMGVFWSFGMHGTTLGGDNEMWSTDSIGGVEQVVAEQFDTPVVVAHWQGAGGDASPRGSDDGYARLETIGEYAVDAIMDLWAATPVSSDPIRLETTTHAIDESRDAIEVTRNGAVDWRYAPYDPSEDYAPDEVIWNEDGTLASPIDEFNTEAGGAFCGSDIPLIPGANVGSSSFPYSSCIDVSTMGAVIAAFFDLQQEDVVTPMPESLRAVGGASRFGPVPIREADGSETSDDLFMGFVPGEAVAVYAEQFRRRATAELGYQHPWLVAYALDHEGYLLTPEDWLLGGYEIEINVWGPLQGEYIMEQVLDMGDRWLSTDELEPADPDGAYTPSEYADFWLDPTEPDATPDAGTVPDAAPEGLYVPIDGLEPEVEPEPVLPRVEGIAQLVWKGGDPGVDLPHVVLERQEQDGTWTEVTSNSGRAIDETMPDILLTWTPDPLYPYEGEQTHWWWAAWQAVGHVRDRAGVPAGTYRLHVTGQRYAGGGTGWPWPSETYEVTSEPFEVEPATLDVSWDGATLSAALPAPATGWRLVHLDGSSTGDNPLVEPTVTIEYADGTATSETPATRVEGGRTVFELSLPADATAVTVTDAYGNSGSLALR